MNNLTFETAYQKLGFSSQRRYPNEALLQFVGSHFFRVPKESRKDIRILEIGCGSGANLWMVAKEGFDAYGIDIAPTGIELCRQMLDQWETNATVKVESMMELSFNENHFDAIFDVTSMQHLNLDGHKKSYAEIFRCLKPGGLFFQWHLGSSSTSFIDGGGQLIDESTIDNIRNQDVPLYDNGMTCFLSASKTEGMLDELGFDNINIESVLRSYKNITQHIEYLSVTARKPI